MSKYLVEDTRKVTTQRFGEMKRKGEKIAMLTAYDYTTASIMDAAGVDAFVLDSAHGHNSNVINSVAKVKKAFDAEVQEFTEELITDEFRDLNGKPERTQEEDTRFAELADNFNKEYQEFLIQKGNEDITLIHDTFTIDEYSDILEVNAGNDVEINGNKISAVDFMEVVMSLFVSEE